MFLLIGLGNPGEEFKKNRHNIGFMVADELVRQHIGASFRSKFLGESVDGKIENNKIIVLKPSTYMNRSGQSVLAAASFFKLSSDKIIVFHDELDLVVGKVRVKRSGGHGGHNGIRSIQEHIGNNFTRVRIGIGHPGSKEGVISHVLRDFEKKEEELFGKLICAIGSQINLLISENDTEFMNKVATEISHEVSKFQKHRLSRVIDTNSSHLEVD